MEVLRISQEFPEKYSWEILRNFLRKIQEKFSGISINLYFYLIPLKICKLGDQVLKISQEFPENFSEISETEFQNCDPTKISHLGDQFWRFSPKISGILIEIGSSKIFLIYNAQAYHVIPIEKSHIP